MNTQPLPPFITQYFWGDDLSQLNLATHQKYISQVILERGNQQAIKWLFSQLGSRNIKEVLPSIKLSKRSSNFWTLYFSNL